MVAATYTSDLTDLFLFESTTGITAWGGGAAGLGAGPDYAIEGTNAVDKQVSASEKGFLWDNVSNFTIGADDHFFEWVIVGVPGLADTRDNRGIQVCIGDDTSNFVKFHVNGSDTLPTGGLRPYAIRFDNTTLANLRTLVGTPGTTPSQIGCGANITGTARFANLAADAARLGTGYDILNGTGADPEADFAGIASDDESTSEGIFQTANGGFNLQGKLRIGSASTACEFLDANTNVFILDTIHSLTDFTEILIEHASSVVTLTNVSFIALGTNNPGRFEVLTSAADVNLTGVAFIDTGVTVLGSGTDAVDCRWIGTGVITQNGATLTGGTVEGHTAGDGAAGLVSDTPNLVSNMTFPFIDGHAIEITSAAGSPYTFSGNLFTGAYGGTPGSNLVASSGSTDAMIYNNSGAAITINISGGGTTPSIRNGAGATTTVSADTNVTFTGMKDNTEVRVYLTSTGAEIAGIENATAGSADDRSFTWSEANGTDVFYMIHNNEWETIRVEGFIVPATDTSLPIQQRFDRNFSNP